ncbi:MAG TPA: DUF1844 domain-containing protein [Holophagaceae bacterium]|nr:DUF1844 domain-containing protein [Holophagaceae bacterium]
MQAGVPEPSFSALVQLLAEQALLALGVPHPQVPVPPPANPEAARFYVDLLSMLRAKSEGHRTDQESRELETFLHELRMRVMDLRPAPAGSTTPARPR